jgi:mannose-6-phosphate isomerase-like protein (cupin superfamily)
LCYKSFLEVWVGCSSFGIASNHDAAIFPPNTSLPFYHKHRLNEEIYVFVRGQGEFQVDEQVFPVGEGSVVRVDPEGERCMRNISATEDLCLIVIQSRVGSYPDHTIQDGFAVQKQVTWVGKQQI